MLKVVLELSNGVRVNGPEENKKAAEELVKEMNTGMESAFAEFEDEGESTARNRRDDSIYEFEDKLAAIDFVIDTSCN